MSRATDALLDDLHSLTAETLIAELRQCREHKDASGNLAPLPVPPALIAQALKFLKDNGVDAPAVAQRVGDALAACMPDFDADSPPH